MNRTHTGLRLLYAGLGSGCVALGVVGLVVPGLPTTVFLLAASWLFARSSPRLHRRLLAHPRLGAMLRAAAERRMPRRAKLLALSAMWGGIGASLPALREMPVVLALVAAMGLAGTAVLVFHVRTAPLTQPSPRGA